jgi:hypothetical protein
MMCAWHPTVLSGDCPVAKPTTFGKSVNSSELAITCKSSRKLLRSVIVMEGT